MNELKEYKLKNIGCSFLSGYAFKSSDYAPTGAPLIKIGNIQNRLVEVLDSGDFVSEFLIDNKIEKYFLSDGDILIAMTGQGSVGRVGKLKLRDQRKPLLNQRVGKFICDEKNLNIDYLYYVLTTEKYQDLLFNTGSGSGQPNLSPESILDVEIPAPSYSTQKKIAEILLSLDDKIDLLQRQNKTLEQLAETLFRQWFVEEVEESWETKMISEVASINNRTISKNFLYPEIDYLDTGSITEGKVEGFQTYSIKDAPSRAQRIVIENDIVYSVVRPIQRHYGMLHDVKPNTIVSTGFAVITCDKISPHFIYVLLTQNETVEYLDMVAEGSTSAYPSLKPSDISDFEFQLPPNEKLKTFHEIADNNWKKIKSNSQQIRIITQLRDALLPKLISGEVRVGN